MRTILLLTQHFPPEVGAAANRLGFFASFLSQGGFHVSVLTSVPNYPEGNVYRGWENRLFQTTIENGVKVVRVGGIITDRKNSFTRAFHYISFLALGFFAGIRVRGVDVILASSPPPLVGLAGALLGVVKQRPLVLDIRDLWPESIEAVGIKHGKLFSAFGRWIASFMYRRCSRLIVNSKKNADYLEERGQENVVYVPSGIDDRKELCAGADREGVWKKYGLQSKKIVLYAGVFGLAQDFDLVFSLAKLLEQHADIVFVLVGGGVKRQEIERKIQEEDRKNICVLPSLSRDDIACLTAAADICLVLYRRADAFRRTQPSKLFEYMHAGKPVLINLQGEAGEIVKNAGCGYVIENDTAAFASAILTLLCDTEKRRALGRNGKSYVRKHFNRDWSGEQLIHVLDGL